jgi:hypothetical protein
LRIDTFPMKMLTCFLVSCFHDILIECSLAREEKGRRGEEEGENEEARLEQQMPKL